MSSMRCEILSAKRWAAKDEKKHFCVISVRVPRTEEDRKKTQDGLLGDLVMEQFMEDPKIFDQIKWDQCPGWYDCEFTPEVREGKLQLKLVNFVPAKAPAKP